MFCSTATSDMQATVTAYQTAHIFDFYPFDTELDIPFSSHARSFYE
jgi:hypothetical protein